MYTEEELHKFYNPTSTDPSDMDFDFEEYQQDILDTCNYFIIAKELGQDVADSLLQE